MYLCSSRQNPKPKNSPTATAPRALSFRRILMPDVTMITMCVAIEKEIEREGARNIHGIHGKNEPWSFNGSCAGLQPTISDFCSATKLIIESIFHVFHQVLNGEMHGSSRWTKERGGRKKFCIHWNPSLLRPAGSQIRGTATKNRRRGGGAQGRKSQHPS